MLSETDFPAQGKVTAVKDGLIIFIPRGTRYQMHLKGAGAGAEYSGAMNKPIECLIRAAALKIWTVPSGGNFIEPIVGKPRIVQGRIRHLTQKIMVVAAGTNLVIELPVNDSAYDLSSGPLAFGAMVNVTVLPGTSLQIIEEAAVR